MDNKEKILSESSAVYSTIKVSKNQIITELNTNIPSFSIITIVVSDHAVEEMTKPEAINTLVQNLKRVEIIELIHHLYYIKKRNSNPLYYLQYILIGILNRHGDTHIGDTHITHR